MRSVCPCCGRAVRLPTKLPFLRGRYRNHIIELVAKRPGISMRDLADLVYAHDPDGGPDDAPNTLRVLIHHMKAPLAKQGWQLAARRAGYDGYRLSRIA